MKGPAQVDVFTEGVTRDDKWLVITLAVVSTVAAGLLLEFLPAGILDFQWRAAAAELGWLATSLRRRFDLSGMVSHCKQHFLYTTDRGVKLQTCSQNEYHRPRSRKRKQCRIAHILQLLCFGVEDLLFPEMSPPVQLQKHSQLKPSKLLEGILSFLSRWLDLCYMIWAVQAGSATVVPEQLLKGATAVAAGLLGGLLTPAASRAGRCLVLAQGPPHATRPYISFATLSIAAMQLAIGLPSLGASLWVSISCKVCVKTGFRDFKCWSDP